MKRRTFLALPFLVLPSLALLAGFGTTLIVPMARATPVSVRDAFGRTVTLAAPPQRIVTIFASNTEMVAALGLADRIVGIEAYTRYPPELLNRPLVGGRLDRIDGKRVAALVFHRQAHVINLFIWPGDAPPAPSMQQKDGYNLVRWGQGGLVFWAVSDCDPAALSGFQKEFAAQTKS